VQHSAASSSSSAPKPKRKIEASHDDVIALDPQETYKQTCADIINEYFESEDVGEVANSLVELNHSVWKFVDAIYYITFFLISSNALLLCKTHSYEFVKQAVVLSFDKSNRERELVSYLFSSLYGSVLTSSNLLNGFRILLHRIEDFTLYVRPLSKTDVAKICLGSDVWFKGRSRSAAFARNFFGACCRRRTVAANFCSCKVHQ
jgi:hypothetical protein